MATTARPTFWHRVRFDLVERALDGRTSVVDVGAGSGLLGAHLVDRGIGYRFAESSPLLDAALAERYGEAARDGGGPIDAGTTATLLDVIEHVDDDVGLLRGVGDRMEPGAGLVVTVPALGWLHSSWDDDLGHRRRYSRSEARRAVEAAGFTVDEVSYLFPELVPLALLRRLRPSGTGAAEFPDLPRWVDRLAGTVCGASARLRRVWPVGTSVVVVARRRGGV